MALFSLLLLIFQRAFSCWIPRSRCASPSWGRKAEYDIVLERKEKNVCFTSGLSIWAIYQTAFCNFYHLFSMQGGNKFLSFLSFFWLSSFHPPPPHNLIRLVGTYEYWFVMGNEWFLFLFIGLSPSLHCSPAHIRWYYFRCSWFSSFFTFEVVLLDSSESASLRWEFVVNVDNVEPCWTWQKFCEHVRFIVLSIYQNFIFRRFLMIFWATSTEFNVNNLMFSEKVFAS